MDTTPSGSDPARDFGRRRLTTSRAPTRWGIPVALLAVTFALGVGFTSAQDDEAQSSVMAHLADRSLILDAVALDDRLIAVGERGHILISTDNGSSWRQVEAPTRTMLTGVTFVDDSVGFAVGHDAVILRTGDGGESWEMVYSAPEDEAPLFDVWFADADNGVAIGAYGSHLRTTDGGLTWEFEPISDTDWHLHKIARADDGTLFMAAEAGMVYRSDDGGDSWIELPSPYEGSYFGVLPLEGDTVLLFGLRGHLFRSEDDGENWIELDTGTVAMLTSGIRLPDGTIVIVGLGGTVLVSDDGGRSFSYTQRPGRRGISAVAETDNGELLLVGEFGVMTSTLADLTAAAD